MRAPNPGLKYDQTDEAQFRRLVEQEFSAKQTEIHIGGGLLYEEAGTGKLVYRGRSGTVTVLALP